jgi:hypothetical protein
VAERLGKLQQQQQHVEVPMLYTCAESTAVAGMALPVYLNPAPCTINTGAMGDYQLQELQSMLPLQQHLQADDASAHGVGGHSRACRNVLVVAAAAEVVNAAAVACATAAPLLLCVQPEGEGRYEWADGSSYEGGWKVRSVLLAGQIVTGVSTAAVA